MRPSVLIAFTSLLLTTSTAQSADISISPVEQRIAAAEKQVQTSPKSSQSYNDLALALCRKARDTSDVIVYGQAEKAIEHSLELSAGNYEAQKLHVIVLLGKHEFTQALKLAIELNHNVPDDIGGWGLLVDTNVAIGNYSEAETAAQWILDLRPGSFLGFEKAAGLRELFGDPEGGIEFFEEANRRTSQSDADEHAWLLTQMARLQLMAGNPKRADDLLALALKLFPDSQLALATLAKVRAAEGNHSAAASLLEKRYRALPNSGNLYEWAEALQKAGLKNESTAAFAQFEKEAGAEAGRTYNANLDLIYFYADHKGNPAEALRLAKDESRTRHDLATLDAYAWALYSNGRFVEAREQMDRALAVGFRDPVYFCHAAQIAMKANDSAAVARYSTELKGFGAGTCPVAQPTQSAREVTP